MLTFAFLFDSINGPIRSYSSSPESQVLTLADLTPPTSDANVPTRFKRGTSSLGTSQPLRSSYPDIRNGIKHLSPRDAEVCGIVLYWPVYHFICPCYSAPYY